MRRGVLIAIALFLVSPPATAAASSVGLTATPTIAPYDSVVQFSGAVEPATGGTPAGLYVQTGDTWTLVASGATNGDGTFSFSARLRTPGTFLVRVDTTDSPPVSVALRPRLTAWLSGIRTIGGRLALVGRLVPANAGTLVATIAGRQRTLRVRADGRFRTPLSTTGPPYYRAVVALRPASGYVAVRRALTVRIRRPSLALGSSGVAVRYLERHLTQLHYAVDVVNGYYGAGTRDAVLAFQKVHRMTRTGRVGRGFWRVFRWAHVPHPHIARGNHIEVEKTRQVLFEVRSGRVTHVAHVSTGATGNTPVGRWHIYLKARGFNSLGMFDSMYFLRGFAIHGYHSVPAYPASHGCVRTPIWFAPRIFSRWSVGATVYVFS